MRRVAGVTAVVALSLASGALASVLDLRDRPGEFDQATWGRPNTVLYAQGLVPDDTFWSEFRFRARATSGTINFNLLITRARPDGGGGLGLSPDLSAGGILYNSGQRTVDSTPPYTEFTFNPNINVTPGTTYFAVMDAFSYNPNGSGIVRATPFNVPPDPYPPGEFVFFNVTTQQTLPEFNNFNWSHRAPFFEDLAVRAVWTPEPASLLLLSLGGLTLLRRR